MRVAFFGLPLAGWLLHRDGHDIVYAGICRKGAIGTRRLTRAIGRENVAIVPRLTDPAVVARVRAAKPDLLVSWFWTKRIPQPLLTLPPLGTLGVHPSLLPRHRGPDPYFWTILSGDEEAGVTAHRLERDYDTGAMLGQRRIRVDPTWTAWTLAKKLDRPSLALLRETVAAFAEGRPPRETPQDPALVTEAPSPSEDELELDVRNQDAASLERLVRAAAPFPGAHLQIAGTAEGDSNASPGPEWLVVTRAAIEPAVPRALLPGEAATVNGRAVVRARDERGLALLGGRRVGDDEEEELGERELAAIVARLSRGAALA